MILKKLYNFLLSFFFQKDPLVDQIERMDAETFKKRVKKSSLDCALFSYKDPLVKTMIWNMKFRRNKRCFELAEVLLHERINTLCKEMNIEINVEMPIIIPVPISGKRRRERGYNQTELMIDGHLRELRTKLQIETGCIVKKYTPSQTSLSREERKRNLRGSFTVIKPSLIRGRNIIILDDVITTGATMEEMTRVLKEAGAMRVIPLAFAH